jgi:Ca2+-binding RTX toxin-like protein
MTLLALNDLDRSKDGIATGNVISGKDTLSGNAGKDGLGLAPNLVTKVEGMTIPGQDIMGTYGKLHMNADGSYTYTRNTTNIWDGGGLTPGASEHFAYEITDKNNNHSTATLTINLLAEAATTLDKNGTHNGTAFDDFINGENLKTVQGGLMAINGGDGADKIVGQDNVFNHLIGGAGNDWLIAGGGNLVSELEGGLGADRLDGGMSLKATATYANSKAAVTVEITADGSKNHGGDAEGDSLVSIANLIGSKFGDTLTGDGLDNSIKGAEGNDTLNGQNGQDKLYGGAGNDTLHGGADGDELEGGAGADHLFGDGGADTATYAGAAAGIVLNLVDTSKGAGDAKGDTFDQIEAFTGSAYGDKMIGDQANNTFGGYFGDDVLIGGGGQDLLDGGDGSDVLIGGAEGDILYGGTETLHPDAKDTASYEDLLVGITIDLRDTKDSSGDAKNDTYVSIEKIQGTQGDDVFWNDDAGDIELHGGKGVDTMHGGEGFNYLYGEAGDDVMIGNGNALTNFFDGGAGADHMTGAAGSDDTVGYVDATAAITLDLENSAKNTGDAKGDTWSSIESFVGSHFADKMYGDSGANIFFAEANNDTVDGRGGDDTLYGEAGNDTVTGGEGKDTLHGGEGNDKLMGGTGNDTLEGGNGNDTLQGGEDIDKLHGEQGNDILDGGTGNDLLWGEEGKDTLTGGLGNDSLYGGTENDTLNGGDGMDYLYGGDGSDKLTGGAAMDIFNIDVADSGKDTITDFKYGEDKLILSDVLDDGNSGNDLQDLLDNGIQASSSGSTLTITEGGEAIASFTGWTGPQIGSIQDLSAALGQDMIVTHA